MPETRTITLTVNGKRYQEEVEVRVTLADFLRHQLGLTGTHLGCEHGVCGACTILLDGVATRSCQLAASDAVGKKVVTIEGLGADFKPQQEVTLVIRGKDGKEKRVAVLLRIDTPIEVDYYKHGGILPFVLRSLLAA